MSGLICATVVALIAVTVAPDVARTPLLVVALLVTIAAVVLMIESSDSDPDV